MTEAFAVPYTASLIGTPLPEAHWKYSRHRRRPIMLAFGTVREPVIVARLCPPVADCWIFRG
jgi:hypothetical protein